MALTTAAKNALLNTAVGGGETLGDQATHVSLHTADPGTTGANEATGGSPAYARQAITWAAASGGAIGLSAQETFDVPGSTTVSHFGLWDASTAGNFIGGGALSAAETFAAQGTYTLTDVTVTLT